MEKWSILLYQDKERVCSRAERRSSWILYRPEQHQAPTSWRKRSWTKIGLQWQHGVDERTEQSSSTARSQRKTIIQIKQLQRNSQTPPTKATRLTTSTTVTSSQQQLITEQQKQEYSSDSKRTVFIDISEGNNRSRELMGFVNQNKNKIHTEGGKGIWGFHPQNTHGYTLNLYVVDV